MTELERGSIVGSPGPPLTFHSRIDYTLWAPTKKAENVLMIRVRSLSRTFGEITALNDLSFDVSEGEVLGFLGPNGAGKTTTLRILTGCLGASNGDVTIAGHCIRTASLAARSALGYLPESPPLYLSMTVRDYIDHAARLRRVPPADRKDAVTRALSRTGTDVVADRLIDHLSKGFRQRVGIAQALVHEPPLLILDEPTSGLDPAQMADIRTLIDELRGHQTIVLSTHLLSEVQQTCDRVMILAAGRKVAEGTESELRTALGGSDSIKLRLARPTETTQVTLASVRGVRHVRELADGQFEVDMGEADLREAVNTAAQPFGLLQSSTGGDLEALYLKAVSAQ